MSLPLILIKVSMKQGNKTMTTISMTPSHSAQTFLAREVYQN